MSPRGKRILFVLLGVGLVVRVVLAFATVGQPYDIRSMEIVAHELESPANVYSTVNLDFDFGEISGTLFRWPYPPGFFPWLWISDHLADSTGLPFHGLVQIPAILADIAIAWLVQDVLGRRGSTERTRLAAAAIVVLGPTFLATSGYHGQIDSIAILPAVLGVVLWERTPVGRRALLAGGMIGLGAALKTVPGLAVLALLPSAESWRERLQLVGAAVAVPLVMLLPFAVRDPDGVAKLADYGGPPGAGGISLLLQPGLAERWLTDDPWGFSGITQFLVDHAFLLNAAALAAVAAVLWRLRPPPAKAAVLLWLAVYAVGTGFFLQYLVWVVPFMLIAGYVREAAALQALVLVPTLVFYLAPWEDRAVIGVYVPLMIALWIGTVVGALLLVRDMARDRGAAVRLEATPA
jgi:glycosyl transferase family 87